MNQSNLPKYSAVIYCFNPETKYYSKKEIERQEGPLNRLPDELRLAPAGAENVKVNATKLLLSRECDNGKYSFITGIQATLYEGWYVGNDYEYIRGRKVLSTILFHFSENDMRLAVYYFHRYDKQNTFHRMRFANEAIPMLERRAA